ncbi:MAG: GtrA family protein [Chloroflexi bacterium]|nr:GtrA family protein [Chloroflexota bacterium]
MEKIKGFIRRPEIWLFIKFCMVGLFNTGVDWGFFYLFMWLFFSEKTYIIAKICSFSISCVSSYTMNRLWTFQSKEKKVAWQFFKFLLVSIIGLLLNASIMYLIVSVFHQKYIVGLFFATGMVTFWNFFINKFWTFKDVRPGCRAQKEEIDNSEENPQQ